MQDTHILTTQIAIDLTQVLSAGNIDGAMFVLGCKSKDELIQNYVDNLTMKIENALGFRPDCRFIGGQLNAVPDDSDQSDEPITEEFYEETQPVEVFTDTEESLSYQSEANSEPEVLQAIEEALHEEEAIDFSDAPFSLVDVADPDPFPEMTEDIEMDFMSNFSETLEEAAMIGVIKEIQVLRSQNVPKGIILQFLEGETYKDAKVTYVHSFDENQEEEDPITFRIVIGMDGDLSDTIMVGYGQYK